MHTHAYTHFTFFYNLLRNSSSDYYGGSRGRGKVLVSSGFKQSCWREPKSSSDRPGWQGISRLSGTCIPTFTRCGGKHCVLVTVKGRLMVTLSPGCSISYLRTGVGLRCHCYCCLSAQGHRDSVSVPLVWVPHSHCSRDPVLPHCWWRLPPCSHKHSVICNSLLVTLSPRDQLSNPLVQDSLFLHRGEAHPSTSSTCPLKHTDAQHRTRAPGSSD